jgi:tetratricopeptide (TPR) repeat protein
VLATNKLKMKHILLILTILVLLNSCNSKAQELSSDDLNKIELAKTHISSQRSMEAIEVLKDIEDKSYEAKYLSACAYRDLDDKDAAIKRYEEVYSVQPGYRYTCLFLSQAMLSKIDFEKSRTKNDINIIQKSINLITEGIGYQKEVASKDMLAKHYAIRGQLVQMQGKFDKAIEDLTLAIELDPQGSFYSIRAMGYYFKDQKELACKDFEKGRELGETYQEEEVEKICR